MSTGLYVNYWQPRLTMISLILKENSIVKDIRRMILTIYLTEEALDRHENNCDGSEYLRLLYLGPLRRKIFPTYPPYVPPDDYPSDRKQNRLVLLPIWCSSFIQAAYPDIDLPVNHPSENRIICTQQLYHRLILCYIHKNEVLQDDRYFILDYILEMAIGKSVIDKVKADNGRLRRSGGNRTLEEAVVTIHRPSGRTTRVMFGAIKTFMNEMFCNLPDIRNVTVSTLERLRCINHKLTSEWRARIDVLRDQSKSIQVS